MRKYATIRLSLVLALAAALSASPALAQGKGKGNDKQKRERPELIRREMSKRAYEARRRALEEEFEARKRALEERYELRRDRDDDRYDDGGWWGDDRNDDDDDRWNDRYEGREGGPPFCRNGQGHPVHGRRWCQEKGWELGRDRDRDRLDDGWYDDGRDRYGSYERAHQEFHYRHDRECRMRAAERPLDPIWQLQVRAECKAEHDRWHERAGRRHE